MLRSTRLPCSELNVQGQDGTPRLVIADKAKFPGTFFKGKEGSRADRAGEAGMLFMNDEGTENGGLIFGGYAGSDGVAHAFGHLSFDEYEQDQTMSLDAGQGMSTMRGFRFRITAQR